MTHARPELVHALQSWGFAATNLEHAASLNALKMAAKDLHTEIDHHIVFGPLRRDLSHAISTLQAAATFAGRGDAENTAAVVIGVFTHTASALSWRRPWTRLNLTRLRSMAISSARAAQNAYLAVHIVQDS